MEVNSCIESSFDSDKDGQINFDNKSCIFSVIVKIECLSQSF